ncbi:MAG: NAD(P)H-dependent oxidoreductase [Cyanobacteria bacterium SBLK]|nr:NAD(P)H-dependent oxidoreductase [Cyanobacteria bacterium SBLK]
MRELNILFVNCTLKKSPEISEIDALWEAIAFLYRQKGCQIRQLRTIDLQILPNEGEDKFPHLVEFLIAADILILGTPLLGGMPSSECHKAIACLQGVQQADLFYNKVFGLIAIGDAMGGAIAQICYQFGQLGFTHPPHNTVIWLRSPDSEADFSEAGGQNSFSVNRDARLLVENSCSLAQILHQTPLKTYLQEATRAAKAIAKTAKTKTFLNPQPIRADTEGEGINYRKIAKRVWTIMQAGMQRGFTFKVINLEEEIFQAEKEGKGFIFKTYPSFFSLRQEYEDYDAQKSKSLKLDLMASSGLSVPVSYGVFKTVRKIPRDRLVFPLVAKPDSGSLSRNVFPNLQNITQLEEAAATIEANGDAIKLESHIEGNDYRVLIVNNQYAGCAERRSANVTGDGKQTILELFYERNREPERGDRYELHTTNHYLVWDRTTRRLLQEAGYTQNTILLKGERFYLQEKITAALGSDYIDCSDRLHESIIKSCIDFSYRFSTLTLGFDLIATDISRPLSETGGAFNEYNFLPYVDLHENCNIGKKRSVCDPIWDYIETHSDRLVTSRFLPF